MKRDDFFAEKKEWSRYKDFILNYYLTPYLEKVKGLNRPILIVDCCAGPGTFDDQSKGSPLIIADHIERQHGKGTNIRGLFLEKNRRYFSRLEENLAPYSRFAEAKRIDFNQYLSTISTDARTSTVFLYVDPYGIKELLFVELAAVYESIMEHDSSVEILLNFNSPALVRCGLAALSMDASGFDIDEDDRAVLDVITSAATMTPAEVDAIAGGEYWRTIVLNPDLSFAEKEQAIAKGYLQEMSRYFKMVCSFPVYRRYGQLPKYRLVYGTRHPDGIVLMNDTMYKARELFLKEEFAKDTLFDLRPPEETKNFPLFRSRLFEITRDNEPIDRKTLMLMVMQEFFCLYSSSDYKKAVKALLEGSHEYRLYSESGKIRINDHVPLSSKPFK